MSRFFPSAEQSPLSRPLDDEERTRMERTGVCMGCHQNMGDPAFWTDGVVAKYGVAVSNDEHIEAMNRLIQDAVAPATRPTPAAPIGDAD